MAIVGEMLREFSQAYSLALAFFYVAFDKNLLDSLGSIDRLHAQIWALASSLSHSQVFYIARIALDEHDENASNLQWHIGLKDEQIGR